LRNHWLLEPHFLDVEGMDATAGRVRVRGPMRISRLARTRVVAADPPSALRGTAEIGRKTKAVVRWRIVAARHGSTVTVTATVEQASALDRLLLALGGTWWLRRLFRNAVGRLDGVLENRAATAAVCGVDPLPEELGAVLGTAPGLPSTP
jgi:hypothetical protein